MVAVWVIIDLLDDDDGFDSALPLKKGLWQLSVTKRAWIRTTSINPCKQCVEKVTKYVKVFLAALQHFIHMIEFRKKGPLLLLMGKWLE